MLRPDRPSLRFRRACLAGYALPSLGLPPRVVPDTAPRSMAGACSCRVAVEPFFPLEWRILFFAPLRGPRMSWRRPFPGQPRFR